MGRARFRGRLGCGSLNPDLDRPAQRHPGSRPVDWNRQLALSDDPPVDISNLHRHARALEVHGALDVLGGAEVRGKFDRPSIAPLDHATESMNGTGVEQGGENRSTDSETEDGGQEPEDRSGAAPPGAISNVAHPP